MRVKYTYSEFKDYPEATEISKEREAKKTVIPRYIGALLVIAIVFLCFFGKLSIDAIIGLVLAIIFMVLLLLYYIFAYDKVTQKKISKAIAKRDIMNKEIKESKFVVKSIKYLCEVNNLKCMICFKNTSNSKYRIKNDIGTRDIPICDECFEKFKTNSPDVN